MDQYTPLTAIAGADLTAGRYKAVIDNGIVASTDKLTVAVQTTANAKILGILTANAHASTGSANSTAGESVSVAIRGPVHAMIGAAVTRGTELVVNASGKLIAKSGAGQVIAAKALESGTADGQVILVDVIADPIAVD